MTLFFRLLLIFLLSPVLNTQAQNGSMEPDGPAVRPGTSFDAQIFSMEHRVITLHVSGGTRETEYTAQQYGQMFVVLFRDTAQTTYPANITVFFEESGKNRYSSIAVTMNGRDYDRNGGRYESGDGVFGPYSLLDEIQAITEQYHHQSNRE